MSSRANMIRALTLAIAAISTSACAGRGGAGGIAPGTDPAVVRAVQSVAVAGRAAPLRVLVLTGGDRHAHASTAASVLTALAAATEIRADTTSSLEALTGENLARYDVLLLANATPGLGRDTTSMEGDSTATRAVVPDRISDAQKAALLAYVRSGKGLVVAHAAIDAFPRWQEYQEVIGGGSVDSLAYGGRRIRVAVEDAANPAVRHLSSGAALRDEVFVLATNPRWKSQVLLSADLEDAGHGEGYADATSGDYPVSWIRRAGAGRVFVTTLGHDDATWVDPAFLQHLVQGVRIAAGRVNADFGGERVKETIATDVWPDDVVADERGNVWIAELTGRLLRYDGQTRVTTPIAQFDVPNPAQIEHGLLGIEIDPDFYSGSPYLYAFRTEPETFINTLSRFLVRDGRLDMSSEQVLLRVPTEPQCCHQAGDLEWGPNKTLFISAGDNGQSGTKPEKSISEARIAAFAARHNLTGTHWSRLTDSERTSQNLQSLRGKVLRINRDGTIPKDNPFYGTPGVRWEIYAYGLRNPYRMKYDAPTGRLFIGVVGPDAKFDYDEINISTKGGENFGWPRTLGRLFYNEWRPEMIERFTPPSWEYTYSTGGSRAAMAGPVYRSEGERAFPQVFQNKVFLYDFSRKWIKWGEVVPNGTFVSDTAEDVKSGKPAFRLPAMRIRNIRTFEVLEETSPISTHLGRDGCLYVAEFSGFWRPAEGANVSRYCWQRAGAAEGAVTTTAAPSGAQPR